MNAAISRSGDLFWPVAGVTDHREQRLRTGSLEQDAGQHLVGPGGEERDQCDRQHGVFHTFWTLLPKAADALRVGAALRAASVNYAM